jgi:hypothetical protein
MATARHPAIGVPGEPRNTRNEEEKAGNRSAGEPPEELRNGASATEHAAVREDEVHGSVYGFIRERGELRHARAFAGGKDLDAVPAVPASDPVHPRAAERTVAVVEKYRPR